jgi:hypothetical protein
MSRPFEMGAATDRKVAALHAFLGPRLLTDPVSAASTELFPRNLQHSTTFVDVLSLKSITHDAAVGTGGLITAFSF